MKCKKCHSENLVARQNAKNPNATEVICGDCGAWQKFASKEEVRLFEIRSSVQPKQPINADRIRSMSDEELARFLARVENRRSAAGNGAMWNGMANALDWLKQPIKEDKPCE